MSNPFKVIGEVRIAKDPTKSIKGFCEVIVAGVVKLNDVKIVDGPTGYFAAPAGKPRMDRAGKPVLNEKGVQVWDKHYIPVDKEAGDQLTAAVLAAYNAAVESAKANSNSAK